MKVERGPQDIEKRVELRNGGGDEGIRHKSKPSFKESGRGAIYDRRSCGPIGDFNASTRKL